MKNLVSLTILIANFFLLSNVQALTPACIRFSDFRSTSGETALDYYFGQYEKISPNKCEIYGEGHSLNVIEKDGEFKFRSIVRSKKNIARSGPGVFHDVALFSEYSQWPDWAIDFVNENMADLKQYAPNLIARINGDIESKQKIQDEVVAKEKAEKQAAEARAALTITQLRASISKLNAGQLFAKADELSSQGEQAQAREVLRALVSRFPDHPLAATAAQQMRAMSNATNNASTTESASGQSGDGARGNSGGSGNVCNGQIPSFIQEKWGRFSNSSIREVYNGTVKPLDRGMADAIRIMGTKAKALQDFESNLADWKVGIVTAADGYCKIQTGCSDHIALLKTWPQALPANMPNSSRGAGASESFAAAYVAQALAIDYFTALKQYFQCQDRRDSTQLQTAQRVQPNQNAASRTQTRNPQTISAGPVSVTLIPTNNPVGRCYDIAYENRGDKHVDIFVKFTLTNNKTGEKGTSDWFGDNTRFDGLFGSANINKMNPKTHFDSTRTDLYLGWLLAQQNFKFSNSPADYYGFNNIVESCDDITAEMPAGGLKWNENTYQRHYDACKSPIKRNRPIGC